MELISINHQLRAPAQAIAVAPQLHVAIISDGNGRWATLRGLPRSAGHRAGAEAARRTIEAAPRLGIHTLTLFALSSANWKRPAAEVNAILRLLHIGQTVRILIDIHVVISDPVFVQELFAPSAVRAPGRTVHSDVGHRTPRRELTQM